MTYTAESWVNGDQFTAPQATAMSEEIAALSSGAKSPLAVTNTTPWTIDADAHEYAVNTGLTGAVTVNAPTGTKTGGQLLWIVMQGTASRAITWNAAFEASTIALPATTSGTNRLDVGFVWNAAASKWRCIAVA